MASSLLIDLAFHTDAIVHSYQGLTPTHATTSSTTSTTCATLYLPVAASIYNSPCHSGTAHTQNFSAPSNGGSIS
jgi:hypothetical protein